MPTRDLEPEVICMKGDKNVIAFLNEVLKAELTAINQYFLHAEMCENWGYERMAKLIRKESIEEMVHAEKLIERILYLDGTPNMSDYFKINVGATLHDQLKNDLELEYTAVKRLNEGIQTVPEAERRRLARVGGKDPERRRAPHRLAGRTAARGRRDGLSELPGAAVEGRRVGEGRFSLRFAVRGNRSGCGIRLSRRFSSNGS